MFTKLYVTNGCLILVAVSKVKQEQNRLINWIRMQLVLS